MGNSRSKAVDQQTEEDVTTGLTSSTIVEDNNASVLPRSQNVGENSTVVPNPSLSLSDGDQNVDTFTTPNLHNLEINKYVNGGEPPNEDIDVATKLTDDIRSIDRIHISNEQLNTERPAAYHKEPVQYDVQQTSYPKPDHLKLNNAWRRESYRIWSTQGLIKKQVDSHMLQRRTLGDIMNVRQPNRVNSDNLNVTKENTAITEEERKREHRNALRRASYRRKKERGLQEDNQPSSAHTTLSLSDTAFTVTTTETSGLVNDNDLHDVEETILEETCHINEEDRKRDHRNALRRAAYRRKKEKMIADENISAISNSDLLHDDATLPPKSLDASVLTHDNDLAKRIQGNSRSQACYQKQNVERTVEDREDLNGNVRGKRVQRRKSMSEIDMGQSSAQRKASYAKRKNTPCKESLALPRPDITNLISDSLAIPLSRSAEVDSSDGDPPPVMPNYGVCTNDDIDVLAAPIMGDEPTPAELMDEEYYMYRGQGSDNDTFEGDEETSMSSVIPSEVDPLDCVYTNIPDKTHILKLDGNCTHCNARKFVSETDRFCCRNGQIELKQPEPIPELMRLWSSMDADSRHFRENIRFFNEHFAFTTLGVSLDENYTNMKSGVYTFRAHGTIYHNVHSFGPSSRPEHLQLYFYDDDPTLTHRKAATKQLDQDVVKKIVDILKENPYSQQFRSLGAHKDNLDDYRINLNTDKRLDQRVYNRPLSSEVAAIWVEGTDLAKRFDRRITLYGNNNERHSIRVSSGAYDPLSYPLFYPRGELGWHPKLPKRNVPWEAVLHPQLVLDDDDDDDAEGNSRLCVSVRDYYCYMLQTRPAIFNPILC
ncbi:uncharacterized protein [Triticum aestivum]|uniref:uncharacterized protein isoform X2 n=1 Tax=Triticum aestivum TaxID=4565 RepID=UPI001D020970|nr:uncharacterized protein LOC123110339 isoform X2 [Triticum aestivum]